MKKAAIIVIILMAAAIISGCAGAKEDVLVMGFVPMKDAESLIEDVAPLAAMLSDELGVRVEAFTAVNYVAVVEGLGSGQVDFGFIPPFSYVLANSESEAQVVLTALGSSGLPYYMSQFVARNDSGISSLDDLAGKRIAFVDPSSTSGYLFPAAHLVGLGYDIDADFEIVFAGGHDKSLQAIINGDVDAAVMFVDARERYAADFPTAMDVTRVIGYTEEIPNISVTVAGSMEVKTAAKITAALLKIAEDPQGAKMLKDLFNMHGFIPASDSDYDVIRRTAEALDVDLRGE